MVSIVSYLQFTQDQFIQNKIQPLASKRLLRGRTMQKQWSAESQCITWDLRQRLASSCFTGGWLPRLPVPWSAYEADHSLCLLLGFREIILYHPLGSHQQSITNLLVSNNRSVFSWDSRYQKPKINIPSGRCSLYGLQSCFFRWLALPCCSLLCRCLFPPPCPSLHLFFLHILLHVTFAC